MDQTVEKEGRKRRVSGGGLQTCVLHKRYEAVMERGEACPVLLTTVALQLGSEIDGSTKHCQ
jgi:hypothetical protein